MIHYTQLGATLFIAASFASLYSVVNALKYPMLKSVVIDFEDGLDQSKFTEAMGKIESVFMGISERSPLVFLRPRDEKHLLELLELPSIKRVDGFILAKFSLQNAESYLNPLVGSDFGVMPSIEGQELFSHQELQKLKEKILPHKKSIILIRFGLEDMLRQLRMSRKCDESIFDFVATASVVGNFIATFKSAGFAVSGGVYPCFKDEAGFVKDVERDLREGLFSKTIIHPAQIELVNELYKVTQKEFHEAQQISQSEEGAFNLNGKMAEPVTMKPFANEILQRAEVYGIRST